MRKQGFSLYATGRASAETNRTDLGFEPEPSQTGIVHLTTALRGDLTGMHVNLFYMHGAIAPQAGKSFAHR